MNEKKFKAVIVDDENLCIDRIIRSLSEYPEISITGTACNATDGSRLIMQSRPDLIFADVEMPGESGLTMMQQLEDRVNWDTHIVFHTAYNRYLLDALRNSAFDFLLKPYLEEDFNKMIQRWFCYLNRKNNIFIQNRNDKQIKDKRFMVSMGDGCQLCKTNSFVYAEYLSSSKIWSVKLSNETTVFLKRGTTAEDILLLSDSFIQISQYCVINSDYLSSIIEGKCLMIPPFENEKLKITRTFLKDLHERFEGI